VLSRTTLIIVVAATAFLPGVVFGQAASPAETEPQMERRQRRVIVRPSPSAETVERDTQAAEAEIEQRRRQAETIRELQRPSPRRPDLDYDVKSGIQSQRLNEIRK
jgi:hypothetical protein